MPWNFSQDVLDFIVPSGDQTWLHPLQMEALMGKSSVNDGDFQVLHLIAGGHFMSFFKAYVAWKLPKALGRLRQVIILVSWQVPNQHDG